MRKASIAHIVASAATAVNIQPRFRVWLLLTNTSMNLAKVIKTSNQLVRPRAVDFHVSHSKKVNAVDALCAIHVDPSAANCKLLTFYTNAKYDKVSAVDNRAVAICATCRVQIFAVAIARMEAAAADKLASRRAF